MNDTPSRQPNDAEIIAASLERPTDFAAIFDRHYDDIWAFAARRVGVALADDLAAETFARAIEARGTYDPVQDSARPWLFGIVLNLLRQHARSEERRQRAYARAISRANSEGGIEAASDRADAASLAPAVVAALARLSPVDRDALLLLALTDLDYQGIAIATGVPIGTVRSRLHRARRHVIHELATHDGRGGPFDIERSSL